MSTPQLIDYIKNQLKLGRSEDVIKSMLKNAGWQEADIEEGFKMVSGQSVPQPSSPSPVFQPVFSPSVGQSEPPLLGAGALLKNSWQIYKSRFGTFVGITIIPVLIWFAIAGLMWLFNKINFDAGIILVIIFGIVGIILSIWSAAALLYAVANEFTIKESFQQAKRRGIISFFWVGLLMFLVQFGGLVFFIIPGIIFAIWFIFSQFVFAVEGQKGFNALLRSKEYVSGRWGKVWWRMFALGLAFLPIGLIIFAILFGISFVFQSQQIIDIVSSFINVLWGPFIAVYLFSLYNSLKETRPHLVSHPVSGKKGFFIFCAILPIIAIIATLLIVFLATVINTAKSLKNDQEMNNSNTAVFENNNLNQNSTDIQDEEFYNNLGISYANKKEYNLAEENFKKSIEINPKHSSAYNNLGYLYMEQGKYAEAIPFLKKASELDSKWFLPHKNLGYIYLSTGKNDDAIKEWEIAISLGMNDSDISQILKNIKQ